MKKQFLVVAVALFALLSCDPKSPEGSELTPDENKAKMEEIAIEFANLIDPDDFTELTDVVDYLINDIELPEALVGEDNHDDVIDYLSGAASPLFVGKLALLGKINAAATRAADYTVDEFYGVYTYEDGEWIETESDSEFKLVYPFNGETATIVASATGTAHEVEIDGETHAIPATVTASVSLGSAKLVDVSIGVTGVNSKATVGQVTTSVAVCGYTFNTTINVTAGGVTAAVDVKKGDTMLLDVDASASGSNFVPEAPYEDEEWNGTIGALNGTVSIMDKAWAKISSTNFQNFIDGLNDLEEEYDSKSVDDEYADRYTELFNDNIVIFMNYDGSNDAIAYHEYKQIVDEYESGNFDTWGESYIVFMSDGSPFLLDEFFNEDDFSELIDVLEDLADEFDSKF